MTFAAKGLKGTVLTLFLSLQILGIADGLAQQSGGLREAKPSEEGDPAYQNWLHQDVRWIITDEERHAFRLLRRDEERDQFIEAFWQRRDPTPETYENEYKEEHYRRILYTNAKFGTRSVPGWNSDRGRFYITYGPPDDIEFHASSGTYSFVKPPATNLPYESWHYNYVEGLGPEIVLDFADVCSCGDYRLSEADTPHPPTVRESAPVSGLQLAIGSPRQRVQFRNLEEWVSHKVTSTLLPYSVETKFEKATDFTTVATISVQVRKQNLSLIPKAGSSTANVRMFAQLTNSQGRVVETLEDQATPVLTERSAALISLTETTALRPGTYKLGIAVQDINGDKIGSVYQEIQVP